MFGATPQILRMLRDPIVAMDRLFARYGPVVALVAGGGTRFYSPRPVCPGTVFVYGAARTEEVLAQPDVFHNSPVSGRLYPQTEDVPPRLAPLKHWGAGLFALNGEEHRRHRRLMLPVFQKTHVASYRDVVVNRTNQWLDSLTPGRRIDLHREMIGLTRRIATDALFGASADPLAEQLALALQESLQALVSPGSMFLPFDLPGLPYRRFLDLAAHIDAALRRMLDRKREETSPSSDVLALLLRARDTHGRALTDDELISHMNLLFGAGHETTANALAWTCFLLSQHPGVVADLRSEIDGRLRGQPPTFALIDDLPFLEQVVLESLRLLPPVPWLPRIAVVPCAVGGHALPSGTEVIVSVYHTHRDEARYPEPGKFVPRRWEDARSDTFEYLAFGAGPHRCIGAGLAMLELKIVLAMMAQRVGLEYDAVHPMEYAVRVTLTPRRGLPMIVRDRDRGWKSSGAVHGNVRHLVELPD